MPATPAAKPRTHHTSFSRWMNFLVLLLSIGLMVFITYDTYYDINFLHHRAYMRYQLVVCVVFVADFFVRMHVAERPWRFFFTNFGFLLISIPYLNILSWTDITLSDTALYFIRFVPLVRAMYAIGLVASYASRNWATRLMTSYIIVVGTVAYMASLVFFYVERSVNPDVTSYWDALWWVGMDMTTIGCYINPMTTIGKAIGVLLALMGIIMFPVFTVYFANLIRRTSDDGDDTKG